MTPSKLAEDVSQIGQNAQAVLAVVHHEHHAVNAIVRRGDGLDRHASE